MFWKSCLAFALVSGLALTGATLPSTGPDSFGYSGAPISANLRNILDNPNATFVNLGDDVISGSQPIGFNFSFYGNSYSNFFIGSNGFITFLDNSDLDGCCDGQPIPTPFDPNNSDPTNFIAGYWTDLFPPGQGEIAYYTQGSPGTRELIVGYYDLPYFPNRGVSNATFEIILHEGINSIEFQYGNFTANPDAVSIGIQNLDGSDGLQVALIPSSSTVAQESIVRFAAATSSDLPSGGYLITPTGQSPVPEPSTFALLGLGGLLLVALKRRR